LSSLERHGEGEVILGPVAAGICVFDGGRSRKRPAGPGPGQAVVEAERQRLHNALNQLPAYVMLLSPDYRIPYANRFFEERFGRSEGRRCYEYLFQRSEPCENCQSFTPFKTDAPHRWEWTGPDGRTYDVHDLPFRDTDGSRLVIKIGLDVTEVKITQAALRKKRQKLFDVLETLPAMICLLTKNYQVPFANRTFREKFGESRNRRCFE
jgi:PAS domain-containing protein